MSCFLVLLDYVVRHRIARTNKLYVCIYTCEVSRHSGCDLFTRSNPNLNFDEKSRRVQYLSITAVAASTIVYNCRRV